MFEIGVGGLVFFVVSQLILMIGILISKHTIVWHFNSIGRRKFSVGRWHGGVFYAQPFFPIAKTQNNASLNKMIGTYNKMVYFFWGNFLILFLSLLLLNLE